MPLLNHDKSFHKSCIKVRESLCYWPSLGPLRPLLSTKIRAGKSGPKIERIRTPSKVAHGNSHGKYVITWDTLSFAKNRMFSLRSCEKLVPYGISWKESV